MLSLSAWFEKDARPKPRRLFRCITVIGSGGKTSLIWRMAASSPDRKILVTPTTKMFVPPPETKPYDHYYGQGDIPYNPAPGVSLAGVFNEASGKLEALPPAKLEETIRLYDLVLMEGDGARERPFKAWAENEPVVPSFTDLTIGMLPMCCLGEPVSEKLVHRLPIFLALTGAVPGEALKTEHILRLITGRETGRRVIPGLFAKARGKKILFFNQVEDDNALKQARKLAEGLPPELKSDDPNLGLYAIIAGSVRSNKLEVLYQAPFP